MTTMPVTLTRCHKVGKMSQGGQGGECVSIYRAYAPNQTHTLAMQACINHAGCHDVLSVILYPLCVHQEICVSALGTGHCHALCIRTTNRRISARLMDIGSTGADVWLCLQKLCWRCCATQTTASMGLLHQHQPEDLMAVRPSSMRSAWRSGAKSRRKPSSTMAVGHAEALAQGECCVTCYSRVHSLYAQLCAAC